MTSDETGSCGGYKRDQQADTRPTLEDGACGERADSNRGEEWGEEEKVLWADDDLDAGEKAHRAVGGAYGVVVFGVEMLQ